MSPCNNISDELKILFDNDERLVKYSLTKRSCGAAVGEKTLILDWIKGRSARDLLAMPIEMFAADHATDNDVEEYLLLKHFLGLQSGLRIMLGLESGGKDDYCTVDTIHYGPKGMVLVALLDVEGMTDQIKACGGCCGAQKNRSTTSGGITS